MELIISAKQLGRKNALISRRAIEIEDIGDSPTVRQLIGAVVTQQVGEYNEKPYEKSILPFLDQQTIDASAANGKVGFGSIYNENKADIAAAIRTALLAFEDGLFVLFADEQEYTNADQVLSLGKDTVITFVRLTFLAGGYW